MSSYSCISCRVTFTDSELQRLHYKCDWHRYNLKRKVAELPPITQELFEEKLIQQRNQQLDENKDNSQFCSICSKSFSSQNAYMNHMKSKKHKLVESKKGIAGGKGQTVGGQDIHGILQRGANLDDHDDDDEWEDIDEQEVDEDSEAIPPTSCLFCHHDSISVEENIHHMTRFHSFFIPDIDYIVELENLIIYLGAKVGDGKICLYCNKRSRTFASIDAVQKHMRDKGHTKLDYEGDSAMEYADFYDFSSSYPDFHPQEDENEEELTSEPGSIEVDEDTMELVLPSGARAGHRSLKHFYKQSMPPAHLQFKRERKILKNLTAEYKALGWHGTVAVTARKQMADRKSVV